MPVHTKLMERILIELCFSPKQCNTAKNLASRCRVKMVRLKPALTELEQQGEITHRGTNYCLRKTVAELPPMKIAIFVWEAIEPPSTTEVAKALKMRSGRVYSICRRLQDKEYFTSDKVKERPLSFAPITAEVVHGGNYERINKYYKLLHAIIRRFELDDPAMKAQLIALFKKIIAETRDQRRIKSIIIFRNELLKAIREARTRADVLAHTGLRKFYGSVCRWKPVVCSGARRPRNA